MYYDKSMKRTVLVSCVCLLPVWAAAASTCQTRVDAHPRATTSQRVNYCLQAPAEGTNNNPGLVFSGVTPRHPAEQQATTQPTANQGKFDQEKITVERTFVDTRQFPPFKNNTLSEREVWQANKLAAQARRPVEKQMEEFASACKETKAGLKARKTKPGRRLRAPAEAIAPQTDLSVPATSQETTPAEESTEDAAVVQEVQEYVPATPDAQEYVPTQQVDQPYAPYVPAGQEEIPAGTASYAPAN